MAPYLSLEDAFVLIYVLEEANLVVEPTHITGCAQEVDGELDR